MRMSTKKGSKTSNTREVKGTRVTEGGHPGVPAAQQASKYTELEQVRRLREKFHQEDEIDRVLYPFTYVERRLPNPTGGELGIE